MKSQENTRVRPRLVKRVIVLDCSVRVLYCIYMVMASLSRYMEQPHVESRATTITFDGYVASKLSAERGEQTCNVHERPTLKVNSELPYTQLMSLVHDRNADGTVNEHFYNGTYFLIWKYILPFISWDAERMLKLAIDDLVYSTEDSAAFFPLLPWLCNIGGKALRFVHLTIASTCGYDTTSLEAPSVIYMGIAGILCANVAGILATVTLYVLVWNILHRRKLLAENSNIAPEFSVPSQYCNEQHEYIEKISFLSAFFFCIGPSTVHRMSIYTENIFCFLAFSGILCLFAAESCREHALYSNKSAFLHLNAYLLEVLAVALFFLCSACRSNGVLLLIPLFFYKIRTCGILTRLNMFYGKDLATMSKEREDIGYTAISFTSILRFSVHWLRALVYAVIIVAPLAIFQLYMYCAYCLKNTTGQMEVMGKFTTYIRLLLRQKGWRILMGANRSKMPNARPWCYTLLPSVYGFVQKKYWDVGFLWVLRDPSRLHVFLYCGHMYLVTYFALQSYANVMKKIYAGCARTQEKSTYNTGFWHLKPIITVISHTEFALHLHLLVTALTFLLFAHTHVYMRQTLATVSYALYLAVVMEPLADGKGFSWGSLLTTNRRLLFPVVILLFNLTLCCLGGVLFANFLGYT